MKRRDFLAVAALLALPGNAWAEYSVWNRGEWPESWPQELEGLREQAKTYEGPQVLLRRYLIPFTSRDQFEAAWPHLLAVKSKGAPIILVRGPKTDFFKVEPAGVMIQTPPLGKPGARGTGPRRPHCAQQMDQNDLYRAGRGRQDRRSEPDRIAGGYADRG